MKSALLMDDDIARDLKKNSADIKSLSERNYDSSSTPRGVQQIKQSSIAYRMMVELVVGMVFGISIGYGLDFLFNTFPIFLVIFSDDKFESNERTNTYLRKYKIIYRGE